MFNGTPAYGLANKLEKIFLLYFMQYYISVGGISVLVDVIREEIWRKVE
jgi:hypothetical protein